MPQGKKTIKSCMFAKWASDGRLALRKISKGGLKQFAQAAS
jgi:hypothetical protein